MMLQLKQKKRAEQAKQAELAKGRSPPSHSAARSSSPSFHSIRVHSFFNTRPRVT
jgi:hypothetical protein